MNTPRIATAPGVVPVLEVAAGDADVEVGQARYDAAHYDAYPEATYSGLDALWTRVSCETIEAQTYNGRERTTDRFDVGTAELVVSNESGFFDYPSSGASPLTVRPGRMLRVGVEIDGSPPYWLFTGWIDRAEPIYDPTAGDLVLVGCVDAKGEYGRADVGRLAAAVGAGETAPARITRIANAVNVPAHRRQFDPDGTTLVGTQLGARAGDLYDLAADSAGASMYGSPEGYLVYRAKDWQAAGSDRQPDAHIGNRPDDDVCPNSWEVVFARGDFATRVLYGRSGQAPAAVEDPINIARYGVETFNLSNLETQQDAELAILGNRALRVRSFDRAPRIAACTLDAARPGVAQLLATATPFGPSMYSCTHVDPDTGQARFARLMYLTGIEHTITGSAWTARLALDDATAWITFNTRYDTARYNQDRYAVAV